MEIESQAQYRDKVIIGGFGRYLPNLIPILQSENVPTALINEINQTFNDYGGKSPTEREKSLFSLATSIFSQTGQKAVLKAYLSHPTNSTENQHEDKIPQPIDTSVHPPDFGANLKSYLEANSVLNAKLTLLEGIGSVRNKLFAQLGVQTIGDLLYLFPRRYDD